MTRIYHPAPLAPMADVTLSPEASHHVSTVLRLQPGEPIELFCGDGKNYAGQLKTAHKKHAIVQVQTVRENTSESPLSLHVIQGLCRGEKMDWIIQKAVELGVTEISPVITERTQGNRSLNDAEWLAKKHAHYQHVVISACEQSGRSILPIVHPLRSLAEVVKDSFPSSGCRFVLSPTPQAATSLSAITDLPTHVVCLVGPEGGLSEREIEQCQSQGFTSIQLGPRVLRTETAALAFVSAVQARWGDFNPFHS